MDIFNWSLLIMIILGFIIIIISILKVSKYTNYSNILDVDSSIKKVKEIIDQADLTIDDLTLASEEILKRFEEKQKQLLFLYDNLENKKNNKIDIKIDEPFVNKNIKNKKINMLHPMAEKVIQLSKQNMSPDDIAKKLNIGQGEIELIIKFGENIL